jgi:rare lipoprotein A
MGLDRKGRIGFAAVFFLACAVGMPASAQDSSTADKPAASKSPKPSKPKLDHSGKPCKGKASYYGKEFYGRKMADGTPMNPQANIAASKTLPLGTKAEVINLENGKSEVVEIRDRGPYVDGRIVDLSPKVAGKLEILEQGVAPVEVKPIEVPQPDGSVKPGAGASPDTSGTDQDRDSAKP